MTNIVVFGKAKAGKSTLVGYILSLKNGITYNEKKLQNELGNNYDPSFFYAYQLDDSKNERNKQTKKSLNTRDSGTQFNHIRNATLPNGQKVKLIDTPGREHLKGEKEKGTFYGDIGIFCLEINDVASENFLTNDKEQSAVISALMLWSSFAHKRIIIALTKSDIGEFSEEIFKIAEAKVQDLCNKAALETNKIIPVAVIVGERTGHNIEKRSERLSWYSGQPLIEAMDSEIQESTNDPQDNELLFCVDQQVTLPQSRVGKIWRIKIIQGKLSLGDSIILSPVITTDNKDLISVEAKVKTIREDSHKTEEKSEIPFVGSGSIVGLDLCDMYFAGRRIQKKDFNSLYTTCGFYSNVKYITSSRFKFSITPEHSQKFIHGRQFTLIWFGRGQNFSVLDNCKPEDKKDSIITAQLTKRKIALPLDSNGKYYFTSLLIRDENIKEDKKYYEAELISLLQENI